MPFSHREEEILEILLQEDGPVQTQEIADRLQISTRTVQRELPGLADTLKKFGILLIRNRTEGNYISGTPTSKERLKAAVPESGQIDPTDKTARRRVLLFNLLRDRQPRKIFYYSKLLGISETTVGADMAAISPWLKKNNLSLIRKPGYGVVLRGKEADYREAMRRFIQENLLDKGTFPNRDHEEAFSKALMETSEDSNFSFLDADTLQRVNRVLSNINEPRLAALTDNAYAGLVTHIAIAVERIKKGGFVEVVSDYLEQLRASEDYDLAERILGGMEKEFNIAIPEEEIAYVLLHIRGSKLAYSTDAVDDEMFGIGEEELLDMIDRMVDIYDPSLAVQLKSDEDFTRGLMVHLRPVIVRLRSGMNIYNPMLSEIKAEYPDIYENCRRASEVIADAIGVEVSEEEIGFLAMHFGAAQERLMQQKPMRRVVIGVVCASGFGVARLMQAKLEKTLGDKVILKAYGRNDIPEIDAKEVDFFVSTMNLDSYGVDYLSVSPLITAAELSAIEHKMSDYSYLHIRRSDGDFMNSLTEIAAVSSDIIELLRGFHHYVVSPGISFAELLQFLGLKVGGSTRQAKAIADAISRREKMYTQLFPEMGFGLLHCFTDAINRPAFVSAAPKEGFSHPRFKGIKAVVMMLAPDDENRRRHAEVLGAISSALVEREDFLAQIKDGREEAAGEILQDLLRHFYIEYVQKRL